MGSTLEMLMESAVKNSTIARITEIHKPEMTCPICSGERIADLLKAPDRFHLREERYRLVQCDSCSCIWQTNPPDLRRMGDHYTEDYHQAIVTAGEGAGRWQDQVKRIALHKSGGAILDLGCSSGGFLSSLPRHTWKLYGIEMEESTAKRAAAATGAEVFVGDVLDAPFAPCSFDVITCFDVLEHVYSPRAFLTKVREWLKPGGIFYAMMPNIDSWEAHFFGTHWFGLELPRHLFHFSPKSLRYLMRALDFEEVSLTTPPETYIERSAEYVLSSALIKLGFSPTAQAKARPQSFAERALRKGFRTVILEPVRQIASVAGAGPCMEVVFRKKSQPEGIAS